jgi:hypothetical protein
VREVNTAVLTAVLTTLNLSWNSIDNEGGTRFIS